jgi:hypothetical protein
MLLKHGLFQLENDEINNQWMNCSQCYAATIR